MLSSKPARPKKNGRVGGGGRRSPPPPQLQARMMGFKNESYAVKQACTIQKSEGLRGGGGGGRWRSPPLICKHNARMMGFRKTHMLRRHPMCKVAKRSHAFKLQTQCMRFFLAVVPGALFVLLSSSGYVSCLAVVPGVRFLFFQSWRERMSVLLSLRGRGFTYWLASWVRAQTTKTNIKQLEQQKQYAFLY